MRALRKIYLVHAHNFGVETVNVVRLCIDSESLDCALLRRFFLLEIAFHLESAIAAACDAEAVRFALVAWSGDTGVVVDEGVGVGRLSRETSGDDQFLVDFGLEASCHLFDCITESGSLFAEFIQLFFVGHQVRQVEFLVVYAYLGAHVDTKSL